MIIQSSKLKRAVAYAAILIQSTFHLRPTCEMCHALPQGPNSMLSRTRAVLKSVLGEVLAVDSELFSLLQGALNRVSILENNPN